VGDGLEASLGAVGFEEVGRAGTEGPAGGETQGREHIGGELTAAARRRLRCHQGRGTDAGAVGVAGAGSHFLCAAADEEEDLLQSTSSRHTWRAWLGLNWSSRMTMRTVRPKFPPRAANQRQYSSRRWNSWGRRSHSGDRAWTPTTILAVADAGPVDRLRPRVRAPGQEAPDPPSPSGGDRSGAAPAGGCRLRFRGGDPAGAQGGGERRCGQPAGTGFPPPAPIRGGSRRRRPMPSPGRRTPPPGT
jgi:hypothetical protein